MSYGVVAGLTLPARWTLFLLALSATACSLINSYPAGEREHGTQVCKDEKDNDFDGDIDCDDSDCVGFCSEATLEECSDQLDNDGDGLTDATDASCWPVRPPRAERCAEARGVEIVETFQSAALGDPASSWLTFGSWPGASRDSPTPVANISFRSSDSAPGSRQDPALFLSYNTTGASVLEHNLGTVVERQPFAGAWQDFDLSFSASVPPQALLRVAVVPADFVPVGDPPLPGAEAASMLVTLDATRSPAILSLDMGATRTEAELPPTQSLCEGTLCNEYSVRVRVARDAVGFLVTMSFPDEEPIELRAPGPVSEILPPSKLVIWGGTAAIDQRVMVDDLRLRVLPAEPCGFTVPQIPGQSCEYADGVVSFGEGLSVARSPSGEYCALITLSSTARGGPESLSTWRSSDGEHWSPASTPDAPPIELPSGTLVGATVAADDEGFHAAVTYSAGDTVRIGFADGENCEQLGKLKPGPELPDDAEPPSYVISGKRHEVYFTRPPKDGSSRGLFRVDRHGNETNPERVAELPVDVDAPVNLSRVGSKDYALTYPTRASQRAGVGLLVSATDTATWRRAGSRPILELTASLEPEESTLAFDDRGLGSAALTWDTAAGFLLLYTGVSAEPSQPGFALSRTTSVGTALFLPAGESAHPRTMVPAAPCGNGSCDDRETCATCPADCECPGVQILGDVIHPDAHWQSNSSNFSFPSGALHIGTDPPALHLPGVPGFSLALQLERPLAGDFELAFDISLSARGTEARCPVRVGLGTPSNVDQDVPPETGIFASFDRAMDCDGIEFLATPEVSTLLGVFRIDEDNSGLTTCRHDLDSGARSRATLRRKGSLVSVAVVRKDGCGTVERQVEYMGAAPELPALLVSFPPCSLTYPVGPPDVTIGNLTLRLLDDPQNCPKEKKLCAAKASEPSCIDISSSAEHCGKCDHACDTNETCISGVCEVRAEIDPGHCGACEEPLEISAQGIVTYLTLASSDAGCSLCGARSTGERAIRWTPNFSGWAVVSATTDDPDLVPAVALYEGTSCSEWLVCRHQGVTSSAAVTYPVTEGTAYSIVVGASGNRSEGGEILLSVLIEG